MPEIRAFVMFDPYHMGVQNERRAPNATEPVIQLLIERFKKSSITDDVFNNRFTSSGSETGGVCKYPYLSLTSELYRLRNNVARLNSSVHPEGSIRHLADYKDASVAAVKALAFIYIGFEGDWEAYVHGSLAQPVVIDVKPVQGLSDQEVALRQSSLHMRNHIQEFIEYRNQHPELAQYDIFAIWDCEYLFEAWRRDFPVIDRSGED